MNPSPYRTILSIQGEVKSNRSVEHQTNGEHHVAYHSVQATDPKHGWPQVVTTGDRKTSCGLKLPWGIFVVDFFYSVTCIVIWYFSDKIKNASSNWIFNVLSATQGHCLWMISVHQNGGNAQPAGGGEAKTDCGAGHSESGPAEQGSAAEAQATEDKETEKKLSKRERKEDRRKKMHKGEKKDKHDEDNGVAEEEEGEKQKRKKGKRRKRDEEEQEETSAEVESQPKKKKKKGRPLSACNMLAEEL